MTIASMTNATILLPCFGFLLLLVLVIVLCAVLPRRMMKARRAEAIELKRIEREEEKGIFGGYEDTPDSSPTSSRFPEYKTKGTRVTVRSVPALREESQRLGTVNEVSGPQNGDGSAANESGQKKPIAQRRKVRINGNPVIMGFDPSQLTRFDLREHPEEDAMVVTVPEDAPFPWSPRTSQSPKSPNSPVDNNGRRNKKSVVPGELDVAFFKRRAEEVAKEEEK